MRPSRFTLIPAAGLLATIGAHGWAAPQVVAPPSAPETRAQGYRFVVEQVQQQQYLQWEYPPLTSSRAGVGEMTGRQYVYLRLAVTPPEARLLPNLEGLASKVAGSTGQGRVIVFNAYPTDDSPTAGGVWRTQLMAQEVELGVARVKSLQGALIVYPVAKFLNLDFAAGRVPATQKAGAFRATLKEVRQRPGSVAVIVETEWPASLSVTRPNTDSPHGISGITKSGGVLFPSGGNTNTVERNGMVVRTYNLTFLDLKDPPEKIRLEALVRSGAARRIPFVLPEIVLPDALNLDRDPETAETGPLSSGDPLYARNGGRLVVPLRAGTDEGSLLLGLSRRAADGSQGPVRWYLATLEAPDRASLANLAAGHYRVQARWSGPERPASTRPTPLGDVEVENAKTATTQSLEVRGKP